jgi:hypothetical protein
MGRLAIDDRGAFDRWAEGFERLAQGGSNPAMIKEWDTASAAVFAETQQHVHVDTDFLKASGSFEVDSQPSTLELVLNYEADQAALAAEQARRDAAASARAARRGRTFTPKPGRRPLTNYGLYEHERGSGHAWLANTMASNLGVMERALVRGFERTVLGRWS